MKTRFLILSILFYLCGAFGVDAQNSFEPGKVNLQEIIKELRSECPISLGSGGEIMSLEIDNGNLVFDIMINEDLVGENWTDDPELPDKFLAGFRRPIDIIRNIEELAVENNLNLKFIVTSDISEKKVESVLTVAEMKEILSRDTGSNDRALLETIIEGNRKVLPLAAAAGMTVTEMSLTPAELKVITVIDPEIVNVDQILASREVIRQNMLGMLSKDLDPSVSLLASLCAKTGIALVYRYEVAGDSSRAVEIRMSPKELSEALPAQYMAI